MRLSATEDVPDDRLAMLASDLRELVPVDVDEARTGYKSVEPPSWIALLERIPTWAAILGPSAAVFLNELLKEAAKDTYRNKAAIGRALAKPVVAPLRAAASAITRFRKSRERTQIQVGVPAPDEYFGTRLRLEGQDEDSIAVELALFIKHAGGIQAVLDDVQRDGKHVIGQITLTLLPDGTMQAQWMDGDAEIRTTKFPPPAP
jgi:hypothetical protein